MQARLRAQLGDSPNIKWWASETVGRGSIYSFDHNWPSTRLIHTVVLSPSCAHLLLRSFIRLHGVNHNLPFPTAISLYKIVCTIAILWFFSAFAFGIVSNALIHCRLHRNIPKVCPYVMIQTDSSSDLSDLSDFSDFSDNQLVDLLTCWLVASLTSKKMPRWQVCVGLLTGAEIY